MKYYISLLVVLISMLLAGPSAAHSNAVILQYHHVSNDTPASTSVSPQQFIKHLRWLKTNQFDIVPLPQAIDILSNRKRFSTDKVAVITFDDANISVCETAWPILKRLGIPFTLFISTEAVENNFKSQCSWGQLREMTRSGLMTPANHSHRHLHMVSRELMSNQEMWQDLVVNEVERAQELIVTELGSTELLFAYPYGEFNTQLTRLISRLGYIGLGQHSGAIGYESDFAALPRFPVSGQHANLESLEVKLLSLPFPAKSVQFTENPVAVESPANPPLLTFELTDEARVGQVACFNGEGKPLPLEFRGKKVLVQQREKLSTARHRYTCTSSSQQPGRFYWMSHQWLVE